MAEALYTIALQIEQAWPDRPSAARLYLFALRCMVRGQDRMGTLTGHEAIRHFLSAARNWTTPLAEELKNRLKEAGQGPVPELSPASLGGADCPVCHSPMDRIGAAVETTHMSGARLLMCAVCAHLTGTGEPFAVYRHGGEQGWSRLSQVLDR